MQVKAHKYLSIAAGQWQEQKFVFQPNLCVLCDWNAMFDHTELLQEIGLDIFFKFRITKVYSSLVLPFRF